MGTSVLLRLSHGAAPPKIDKPKLKRRFSMDLYWVLMSFCLVLTQESLVYADQAPPPSTDNRTLMERLVRAYPDQLQGYEGNDIVWKDGTRMAFDDDIRDKPFETLLNAPSLRDEFSMKYSPGQPQGIPMENFDPGRIRFEPFFERMYGNCDKNEVVPKLSTIAWLPKHNGGSLKVTAVNGVDHKLAAISKELDELPDSYTKYLIPSAGIYNCRAIAGTSRRSMHAYGAAIDINVKYSHYWQWSTEQKGNYKYQNAIPYEIAAIFEKYGFIWGAKWYHFDTMHFEYRPEILSPSSE